MAARPPGPTSWVGPLTNILKLEEDKGFNNTSVVGGVDRFIQRWAEAITEDLGESEACRNLLETPYIDLTREQRPRWVQQWRTLIARQQDAERGPSQPPARSTETHHPAGFSEAPPRPGTDTASADETAPEDRSRPAYRNPPGGLTVDTPVDRLRGVDDKQSGRLKRLDVYTVRDLLYLSPAGTWTTPTSPGYLS